MVAPSPEWGSMRLVFGFVLAALVCVLSVALWGGGALALMPGAAPSAPQPLLHDAKIVCGDFGEGYTCQAECGSIQRGKSGQFRRAIPGSSSRAAPPRPGSSDSDALPPAPGDTGTSTSPSATRGTRDLSRQHRVVGGPLHPLHPALHQRHSAQRLPAAMPRRGEAGVQLPPRRHQGLLLPDLQQVLGVFRVRPERLAV